ncbi:DEAD/DEAH box helicase [Lysinibacillus sp. NPDC094403]|uniref:DEAD/DEAH box helicase n=1 Tax=Lysinibacillus sp. NPDC094403 TaxID=3390581 RepID=UPI003D063555
MKVYIKLPELNIEYYKKSKNIVKQINQNEKIIEGEINEINGYYFSLVIKGEVYCLTRNKNKKIEEAAYILLIEPEDLRAINEGVINSVSAKRWLKHPNEDIYYSVDNVRDSWRNNFVFKEESIEGNQKGLRRPQIAALYAILSHSKVSNDIATVVMPTGTGKTETMLSSLLTMKCKKLLIIVPSDALRDQVASKFLTLGLLKEFEIIADEVINPKVGILYKGIKEISCLQDFINESNVIVTTMNLLSSINEESQELIANSCSNVFIDEAHHVKATTWEKFRKRFNKNEVIQFTATPFRNDGKNLDGQIIFNFPLKEAQKDGYFTEIEFLPVKEYDKTKEDEKIAKLAVKRLEQDLEKGFPHILMARCANKNRAIEIFNLYSKYDHLQPALIYSGIQNKTEIYNAIRQKKHKIIVCVDMLGEGFDLPELKVAALHDIRKSLPVTLQFTGRFTRTKHDQNLGKAAFIANIADLNVSGALEDLYSSDADWNELLSNFSGAAIDGEMEYKDFLDGFKNINQSMFSFQNLRPKLSTVVYKTNVINWSPKMMKSMYINESKYEYAFYDDNLKENVAIVVFAKKSKLDWLTDKNSFDLKWDMIILMWDPEKKLLYINSTDNNSLYKELAEKVVSGAQLINRMNVFKALHNIKRLKLQNVGLKLNLGRDIRYRMSVGSDLSSAISLMEKQRSQKAYIVGAGFENGNSVNIGCSYKGRIWTKLQNNIKNLKNWCFNVGAKLTDPEIDPNEILKECLVPMMVHEIPRIVPLAIDWDYEILFESETICTFYYGENISKDLSEVELQIHEFIISETIKFKLLIGIYEVIVEYSLSKIVEEELDVYDYQFNIISDELVYVRKGSRKMSLLEFLEEYVPTFWFADGSSLTGNEYVELKHTINQYPLEKLIPYDWNGVNIAKESQYVKPKREDSIQYAMIQKLKVGDYHIIYDDDGSGEIADIITIKEENKIIKIEMYHLKYAKGGKTSKSIENLYQVCGQAQKSIYWKSKKGDEFFKHLLRREQKTYNKQTCSRLERGSKEDLELLKDKAKRRIPMQFEIYIVQPSISKSNIGEDILTLLGVTESFLKETSGINLKIICSK